MTFTSDSICSAVTVLDELMTLRHLEFTGFEQIRDCSEYGFHLKCDYATIAFKNKTVLIDDVDYGHQTFSVGELQKNIIKNNMVPLHEPTTDAYFTGKYPKILPDDPVYRRIGKGRMKITRNDGDGTYPYYRDV